MINPSKSPRLHVHESRPSMVQVSTLEGEPISKETDFLEQAEYINEEDFLSVTEEHPDEIAIIRRLSAGGAKLLVGPRGCGKTTLLLKTYFDVLRDPQPSSLPVYVNFKLSLKLEPLYVKTSNASFWFKKWLNLRVYEGVLKAVRDSRRYQLPDSAMDREAIEKAIASLEMSNLDHLQTEESFSTPSLLFFISQVLAANGLSRCVLLLDDAAHAFSPRQQEDFFDYFREIKSKEVSPKAAIYPGITAYSPTFQVGHDAEQIDAWVRPNTNTYLKFMKRLAMKRFSSAAAKKVWESPQAVEFLAFASFGIPRSFLNMMRSIILEVENSSAPTLDRRKLFEIARQSREFAHGVYDSLAVKVPAYKDFVITGNEMYQHVIQSMKDFNRNKDDLSQALEFGLKRPVSIQMDKVVSFYQYAGLLMPNGMNSRGEKGSYDRYLAFW